MRCSFHVSFTFGHRRYAQLYNFPGEKKYKISAEGTLDKGIGEMQM